jgi:carbamoylphosphate synthase large subunit
MAYEKILMQRLQILTNDHSLIPSALINLSSTSDLCLEVERQFTSADHCQFLIKPAFSSCGNGIECAYSKEDLHRVLNVLQAQHTTRIKSQRNC